MNLPQCGYSPLGLNEMGVEKCARDLCFGFQFCFEFRPTHVSRKLLDHSNRHRIGCGLGCQRRCR